jgi:predicted enzyme related to lactoylglutathione lyase
MQGANMSAINQLLMFHMAVNDMDTIKKFYESKLGFKTTADNEYDGKRWVSMELPGGGVSINLTTEHENMKPGSLKLYVNTTDAKSAYEELKKKGVPVSDQVGDDLYGPGSGVKWFDFQDPDKNHWLVVQV